MMTSVLDYCTTSSRFYLKQFKMKVFVKSVVLALVLLGLERAKFAAAAVEASKVPKIVDQVERINHPEGTNATFTCTIGSGELNGLKFEWLKDDRRIAATSNRYRVSVAPENFNSILRVIDLKSDDSGTYSCVARNAFGQDKISIKLVVKVELKWLERPKDEIEVPIGKQLQVPCTASGQPAPKIEWTRLDGNEQGRQMRHLLGSELRFNVISQQDSGLYECRASNGMDKDLVSRFRLVVMGK
uniref:Contactin-2 n=1 Tax=Aceria tosichella TaxID=561515 RepID=A0A6G1SAW7_9ACAR